MTMEDAASCVDLSEIPQLLRRAEQAMKAPSFLGQIFGKEADYDTAVQLMQQCAQRYKLARVFPEAASCYVKAAEAANKARDTHTVTDKPAVGPAVAEAPAEATATTAEATADECLSRIEATLYLEAGNCMRRYSLADAVPVFTKGIAVLLNSGRLAAAAKVHRQLAEEYEAAGERHTAASHYLKASQLFETDEFSKTQHSHCLCKYAELLAWGVGDSGSVSHQKETEILETAARILEGEGYKASQNNLLQYGAKDLFLKAMLLRLATPRADPGEFIDLHLALGRYGERNPHFTASREAQLLKQLVAAAENRDADAFAAAVESFDAITRLDPWKVHFLLKAKELLGGGPSLGPAVPVELGEDGEVDLS